MLGGAARVPGRDKDGLAQGVDVEGDSSRVPAQDVIDDAGNDQAAVAHSS